MKTMASVIALAAVLSMARVLSGQAVLAQTESDSRVADFVQAGELRVGLGLGTEMQGVKDAATGELRGVAFEIARALATRIGVKLVIVEYPRPGAVIDGLRANAWDVAFLSIDPDRMKLVDFSHPYAESDMTYLVRPGSSIRNIDDADQSGVRIAVPRGDSSDLFLARTLKRAELVRAESHAAALNLVRTSAADAKAAARFVLVADAPTLPGSRILDDGFAPSSFAVIVPKGQANRLSYINEFVENAKASGLIQRIIETLGMGGVKVAPAEKLSLR